MVAPGASAETHCGNEIGGCTIAEVSHVPIGIAIAVVACRTRTVAGTRGQS